MIHPRTVLHAISRSAVAAGVVGGLAVSVGLSVPQTACSATPAQVQSATNTAIDLTNAICALAPDSPVGQPYVEVLCTIAQGVEQTISVVLGEVSVDGGTTSATMSVPVEQIRLRLPAPSAASFLAAHKAAK